MPDWDAGQLSEIGSAKEIEVSALRRDGTLTKPVTIWAVRLGDEVYVRSVRGAAGGWYRASRRRGEGRIEAGETAVDVSFEDAPHHRDEEIDAAYRDKYGYPSDPVDSISTEAAKATTTRVLPR